MSDVDKIQEVTSTPDMHIPLESMPSMDEMVAASDEYQILQPEYVPEPTRPYRKGKVLAWAAGGLTLLGVGVGFGVSIGGDEKEVVPATETTEQPESTAATETTNTKPETVQTTTTAELETPSGETVIVHGVKLKLPVGDSVEDILKIHAFNRTQTANFVDYSTQTEQDAANRDFMEYLVYDVDGDLGRKFMVTWNRGQDYHQGDAFTEFDIRVTDIDVINGLGADVTQVKATLHDGVTDPVRKLFTLRPKEVYTPKGLRTLWLVAYEEFA